jgi:uncharacterized protein (DUF302 family)
LNRLFSIFLLAGLLIAGQVHAEKVMMARSYLSFEVTLEAVKKALESRGYTVAHEQRCDGGLKGFGYETDLYRVIFFGKPDEVRLWSNAHPEMIPYLPLKLAVIAEADQVLVVGFNPEELAELFTDKKLKIQFSRWKNDIESVMVEVSQSSS